METPDKHTVRVHLKTPNVLFPQNLAEPVAVIFPREVLEEDGDLKKRLIGTGPYILKEHTRKVRVVLAAEPRLLRQGPAVLRRVHHPLHAGRGHPHGGVPHGPERLHLAWRARPRWRRSARPTPTPSCRRTTTRWRRSALALAQDKPPFNDVRVRRAISMAIDRQKQVDTVYEGHGILGLGRARTSTTRTRRPTAKELGPWWQYRPAEAKKLLAEAGHAQRLRDDAVLLRVLPADDVAGAARAAGPQEEPQHRRQDHQARLHDVLRPLRRGQVGRHVVGLPVGPRRRPRRADVPVHALEVDEELLPRQRSRSSTS